MIAAAPGRYDAILLDVDNGPDGLTHPANDRLYSPAGLAKAKAALRPGGTFLVSEFPFPEHLEACRTLPGQIMSGVQYFEAHIGCQLLPTAHFVALLEAAGFRDVGVIEVTPVHVVIHGTA